MPLWVDPAGREPKPHILMAMGVAVLVTIAIIGTILVKWSDGDYADRFTVTLLAPQIGDGLVAGADVKYRGYSIGKVEKLDVDPAGDYRLVLSIDPAQASALTTDVQPVFNAPNLFASTGIELVPGNSAGGALADHSVLTVHNTDPTLGTMTSVISRIGKLSAPLADPAVLTALNTLTDAADPYIDFIREALPLVSGLAQDQTIPVGQLLKDLGEITDVLKPALLPVINVMNTSLDNSAYLDTPNGLTGVQSAILGLSKRLVVPLGNILGGQNTAPLKSIIEMALDIGEPVVLSVGTIPNAYDRITRLIMQTGDAFRVQNNGSVRLLVDVLIAHAPQITTPLIRRETGAAAP